MTNPGDSDEWWKQYGGQGVSSESGGAGSVPQYPAAEQPGYPSGQQQYPAAPQYPSQPAAGAPPQYPSGSQPQYPAAPQYPAYQQPAPDPYAQQPYPQPGYGAPYQAGYPGYGMPPQGTNGMAIGALITSCIGLLCCGLFVVSTVGLILGVVAQKQIDQTGQEGRGFAQAAIWVGAVSIGLGVIVWILNIIGIVAGP
ncbi:DUF4190 domain-containing protein [Nocardia cyriacigeorgica]|uniref:DUF4190 domain-containing protein n=1 Tax=Nocardia cyriacigeorgica TaxID=135487 RepID=UPI0013D718EE|nr:DUF4190 domain-containing protein [Nocardia cyriacigeorgica]MBF6438062.1 DUF4190 domain-containing protein [Nocardia cyriacigeorgica]MBF6453597.1 DUF4190 domain-containing protein [Nocardia cyriacigeorgica]MBF6478609.1 DUF4190 domain-containing protein [Nocardia cyriacigeorgica]MBF6550765.1 DUF4190 domain-containing protein [Nocardia cyriacigeorgica]NEW27446.1 DUF4190 domain-containing protein [Nocardia cyriacigeorgica]